MAHEVVAVVIMMTAMSVVKHITTEKRIETTKPALLISVVEKVIEETGVMTSPTVSSSEGIEFLEEVMEVVES